MQGKMREVESFLGKKRMINQLRHETLVAGAKMTPAVGGATWYEMSPPVGNGMWYGLTINEWVGIATLLYVALQIGLLVPKYVDLFNKKDKK